MNKVFQIGFNKCGTLSIHELFSKHTELKSLHWDYGKIAFNIVENIKKNDWLLSGYEHIDVFSDIECCINLGDRYEFFYAYKYFKLLDEQYPNSKFILNTRNINNWISSRLKQKVGYYIVSNKKIIKLHPEPNYFDLQINHYSCSSIDNLIKIWENEWFRHHNDVKEYFQNRNSDLLIYDIEKDPFKKISDFFKNCGLRFDTDTLPHANKTKVET